MTPQRLGAAAGGLLAGGFAFGVLILAGWLLDQRLWPGAVAPLVIVLVVFGAIGLYAGWILGMLVFSALRSAGDED
jgi:hypothetical protein